MKKIYPVLWLALLLVGCTESRYYFNKRIDHAGTEKVVPPVVRDVYMDVNAEEASKTNGIQQPVLETVPVETLAETTVETPSQDLALSIEKEGDSPDLVVETKENAAMAQENLHETKAQVQSFNRTPKSGFDDLPGWLIFLMILAGIFLIAFIIALLLAYSFAAALGIAGFVVLMVIVGIFYLIVLIIKYSD